MTIRAIVGARVSHVQGAEKTSHVDQTHTCTQYAERQGWDIIGSFEDLDVSAISTSPWERPDLRPWLTDRAYDWDALVFAKTDRVFRRAKDAVDLAHWCEENSKLFILVEDGITLDYYHPDQEKDSFSKMLNEIFLLMSSMFAQIEGRRYVQRAQGRVRYLRNTDRWGYGIAPYSHQIVPHPSGVGRALDLDPDNQKVLRKMIVEPLLSGESLTRIVSHLNDAEVPSPRDAARIRKGKPPHGDRWTVHKVKNILSSPSTQGVKVSKGKPIIGDDGRPIRVGPPSFDEQTWARIQTELAERAQKPRERRHSINPLLGVGKCGICGGNLRQHSKTTPQGVTHRYYVCGTSPIPCKGISIKADDADTLVSDVFLEECGDLLIRERVFEPGEDHSYELEEVLKTIEGLREDRALGLFSGPEDEQTYRDQMKALIGRRDELQSKPIKKPGWIMRSTETTYAEAWPSASPEEKRKMLTDAGVSLTLNGASDYHLYVDREKLKRNFL